MKKIKVIFPMAGDGTRFGNGYKPFLSYRRRTFIENALKPFLEFKNQISEFIFIFREDQDSKFDVSNKLNKILKNLNIKYNFVILKFPTKGPLETAYEALKTIDVYEELIFCDCDHQVSQERIFEILKNDNPDALIPIWPVSREDEKSWSFINLDISKNIIGFSEKKILTEADAFFGIIGSYYFKDISILKDKQSYLCNFSEILSSFHKGKKNISYAIPSSASFFGDPERLKKAETIKSHQSEELFEKKIKH